MTEPIPTDGQWLAEATRVLSPNYDDRPSASEVCLLVIHCISLPPAEFGADYISRYFCNQLNVAAHPSFDSLKDLRVSSHLLIRRDGALIQFVPFDKRAWHAGQSAFRGRENCNDFSIGVELEGHEAIPYSEMQYHCLARSIASLMAEYPSIQPDCIVGHEDIAADRKTDPGPLFNWARLRSRLAL